MIAVKDNSMGKMWSDSSLTSTRRQGIVETNAVEWEQLSVETREAFPSAVWMKSYLKNLKSIYDRITSIIDPVQVYGEFLKDEEEYATQYVRSTGIRHSSTSDLNINYASVIHAVSPNVYHKDMTSDSVIYSENVSMRQRLRCPHCSRDLPIDDQYKVHILCQNIVCSRCCLVATREGVEISIFIRDLNSKRYAIPDNKLPTLKFSNKTQTWEDFFQYINETLDLLRVNGSYTSSQVGKIKATIMSLARTARQEGISIFSRDLIQGMYIHMDFLSKICGNYSYWTNPSVIMTSINRYRKFLTILRSHPRQTMIPTLDIELVWNCHQHHVNEYRTFVLTYFGRVIDHLDSEEKTDANGSSSSFSQTYVLWAEMYHEEYSHTKPSLNISQSARYMLAQTKGISKMKSVGDTPHTSSYSVIGTSSSDTRARPDQMQRYAFTQGFFTLETSYGSVIECI